MRIVLLVLAMATIFTSCKDKTSQCDDSRSLHDRIQGAWTLTEIFNPWTQETHAPTEAEQQTLEFAGDSLTVRNAGETITAGYEITEQNDGAWLYSNGVSGSVKIDCNVLVIDNTPVDGPKKTYSRVLEE